MKIFFIALLFLALFTADSFARGGGGFSGGRSSFGGGRSSSFSSGRSSFSAPKTSSPVTINRPTPSKSTSFGTSSRGSFGMGSTTTKSSTFGTSTRGKYGSTAQPTSTAPTSNREVLSRSTVVVNTPYHSVPIYYYYYPTHFYGSGYGFYHWYFWSHFWGYHSHCYHQGGGLAPPTRKCDSDKQCYDGEKCNTVKQCQLKQ